MSHVLYQIQDDRIYYAFAGRLNEKETEESYYVANYLAKRGHESALATLNRHFWQYPVSSWQMSYTAELFGKYKYQPALSNLVDCLDAASLNLAAAACEALREFYPGPRRFATPEEAKEYYVKRLREGQVTPAHRP